MTLLKRWALVALDAVPWHEYESLDAALGEINRMEDELAELRAENACIRSLWISEDEIPTVVGMQPVDGEEVVR